jgi:aryl-alcohol dehydrogenase-like predicted oxidoreductase
MQTITLWNGRKVPLVGVGCWAIGGGDYGEVHDMESLAGLRLARQMGAELFDTALGHGHSEPLPVPGFKTEAQILGALEKGPLPADVMAEIDAQLTAKEPA